MVPTVLDCHFLIWNAALSAHHVSQCAYLGAWTSVNWTAFRSTASAELSIWSLSLGLKFKPSRKGLLGLVLITCSSMFCHINAYSIFHLEMESLTRLSRSKRTASLIDRIWRDVDVEFESLEKEMLVGPFANAVAVLQLVTQVLPCEELPSHSWEHQMTPLIDPTGASASRVISSTVVDMSNIPSVISTWLNTSRTLNYSGLVWLWFRLAKPHRQVLPGTPSHLHLIARAGILLWYCGWTIMTGVSNHIFNYVDFYQNMLGVRSSDYHWFLQHRKAITTNLIMCPEDLQLPVKLWLRGWLQIQWWPVTRTTPCQSKELLETAKSRLSQVIQLQNKV